MHTQYDPGVGGGFAIFTFLLLLAFWELALLGVFAVAFRERLNQHLRSLSLLSLDIVVGVYLAWEWYYPHVKMWPATEIGMLFALGAIPIAVGMTLFLAVATGMFNPPNSGPTAPERNSDTAKRVVAIYWFLRLLGGG